ncbi:MAG: PHP domain-containing protein, partial [Gammaproteobacteria bacterium]|nr:PHP domain-containing protein [Gammaproteobacteria bacterium]
MTGFVHLLVHTEYSISDSLVRIGDLARRTSQMSMPAVAMTDRCALFALVKFYEACLSAGVKPIVGADFHYRHGGDVNRCVLLAASDEGYANLLRFVSRAYVDTNRRGRHQHGLLERQWILSAP